MSLPPGFLDELRNRTPLSQVVGRKVTWDMRKSNQGKGDFWAPCPFHQEKSASFHVDDRKGFYYCFGCHAKGDALSFVRETENVGFMEAVEILAREAGMPMPARDPKAQEKADRNTELAKVMEAAVQFYRLQLSTGQGSDARAYLDHRQLSDGARQRFEVGFAPAGWQTLWDHLRGKGVAEDLILGAGLAKASTKGKQPYDTFRNRIMFPIRDARGRAIAFGGRAMDPNDNAKYLNSPETPLFDKGRSLYNHGPAREGAGKGKTLVVAEGYMDVIALSEAGFTATVAPLGTAITEDQLRLLWRISPEPVIALDGDTAGLRAAMRVIDVALPMLEAGNGLRFCLLPEGLDPDDLIKTQGAGAMQTLLEGAIPMVNLLWRRETEGKVFDSPERRAALDKSLRATIKKIADPSIRSHYGEVVADLRRDLFGQGRGGGGFGGNFGGGYEEGGYDGGGGKRGGGRDFVPNPSYRGGGRGRFAQLPVAPTAGTKGSFLVSGGDTAEERLREAVILAVLITHPVLIPEFEHQLEELDLTGPGHAVLRGALLRHADLTDSVKLKEEIRRDAGGALETLFSLGHVSSAPPVLKTEDTEFARMCVAEELAKLDARRGVRKEIEHAVEDLGGLADEGVTWRLGQAAEAMARAGRSDLNDSGDLGEDRSALSQQLQALIDSQVWVKKRH